MGSRQDNGHPGPEKRRRDPDSRIWAERHPWLSALGLIALAVAALIAIWDWNWFRGPVERLVEARTGRDFEIGGPMDVDLGRTPVITLGGRPRRRGARPVSVARFEVASPELIPFATPLPSASPRDSAQRTRFWGPGKVSTVFLRGRARRFSEAGAAGGIARRRLFRCSNGSCQRMFLGMFQTLEICIT